MKNPQALPSRSSTSEKVSGAVSHHCSRTPTAEGPSCRRAIASTVPHPAPEARSTDNGCAPLGKNASRTTGLSIRYNMSAVNRHNSVAGASRDSPCNCLHAARRYCRYRSGLAPRRYPEMDSRTASCTTNPSRHASTNGRSTILPSNRSASTVSPSIATSNGPVTRRTTDPASSACRVTGSSTSSRNSRVSVFTTRVSAAFSSDNSGCSETPAAARTRASGCPRAIRARRSIAAGRIPNPSSSALASSDGSGPNGTERKPGTENHPATGRSRAARITVLPGGNNGTKTCRNHVSIKRKCSNWSHRRTGGSR